MQTIEKPVDQSTPSPTPTPSGERRGRPLIAGGQSHQLLWLLLAFVVTVMVLTPIVPLQIRAWEGNADGMQRLLEMPNVGEVFKTTLFLGVGGMVVGLLMGTILALCVYSMTPRLRKLLEFTPVLPMIIPSVAHVVGFVFLLSPENGYINSFLQWTPFFDTDSGPINVYTLPWIIIYTGTHLAAFVYLFVYTGLRNLGSDYTLAARVNGSGGIRALFTITLPLLRPTFIYAGVVVLLLSLGQFTGPLILGRREGVDVLTTKMYEVSAEYPIDYALASALGTPLIILALVLVVVQRKMLGNQNRFVGQGAATVDNRRLSPVASGFSALVVIGYVMLSAVLPLLALGFVAVSPFWSGSIDLGVITSENFSTVWADPAVRQSIVTTLVVSILGVLLVLPLGMLIALGIYNKDKLWRPLPTVLDVVSNLPLTVPAALLGFGFLFAFSHPSIRLYGTQTSLILAYMTIMIPYSVRYQLSSLVALGRQTTEASQVAGAHPIRTFIQVILPLCRAGIVSSAAIMFVLLTHEFGVSLLLRAPDVSVMSVVLYDQYNGGSYPRVAVIAILMTAITALGVAAAMFFGGRKALEKL